MAKRRKAPTSPEEPSGKTLGVRTELFIITGVSGSGKGTVLKALEDLGYYAVDNLPMALLETFARLVTESASIRRAAIVVDIREGDLISKFPEVYSRLRGTLRTCLLFLDAEDDALVRRFSETRRPHPLGNGSVLKSVQSERKQLEAIRDMADQVIVTSDLTSAQLRKMIGEAFSATSDASLRIAVMSFGFRHGVPAESDLVLDVRFLPNPNYVPEFKPLSGKNPRVARYIQGIPPNRGIPETHSQHAGFPAPALCGGGQSVFDHHVRLHRRAAQVGDDGRRGSELSPARGLPREDHSPRYREIKKVWSRPFRCRYVTQITGSTAMLSAGHLIRRAAPGEARCRLGEPSSGGLFVSCTGPWWAELSNLSVSAVCGSASAPPQSSRRAESSLPLVRLPPAPHPIEMTLLELN